MSTIDVQSLVCSLGGRTMKAPPALFLLLSHSNQLASSPTGYLNDPVMKHRLAILLCLLSCSLQPGTLFFTAPSFIFKRVAGSAVCIFECLSSLSERCGHA
jgi:hypothetical protein